jgi:hypothetical protein
LKPPLHVPVAVGRAAIAEIDRVPWSDLENAYGRGPDEGDHADVRAALALLSEAVPYASDEAINRFYGNICHQGTIYEATAYVVPFLAAYAAGADVTKESFDQVADLLRQIALAASFDAPHGSHAGSWGPGVGASTRSAFAASAAHLRAMSARRKEFMPIERAIAELATSAEPGRNEGE